MSDKREIEIEFSGCFYGLFFAAILTLGSVAAALRKIAEALA